MKILIIKLTSMGDLMHALPALTEARTQLQNVSFDWVVDTAFESVPMWHPAVNKVITTDHRNWKKQLLSSKSRDALKKVRSEIEKTEYDLVIDMQNNLKSAFLSFLCNQPVTGMDAKSAREYPSHLAYSTKINVSKGLHAITRQKIILSEALKYPILNEVNDYGISSNKFIKPTLDLPSDYMVLVQNASWKTKQWSIENWKKLIDYLDKKDIKMLLPSGNNQELKRAKEICSASANAKALEILPLNEIAYIMNQSMFNICSDTGLAHLSAVVETPSLTLYGPTDTKLIGTIGKDQSHIIGEKNNINNISVEEVIKKLPID